MRPLDSIDDGRRVSIVDQRYLPHENRRLELESVDDCARAIRDMEVRGAPLIGATGAFGLAFALRVDPGDESLERAYALLLQTRPTAVNLRWALDRIRHAVGGLPKADREATARAEALAIIEEEAAMCRAIGEHGVGLIAAIHQRTNRAVNVLTHCNAGWLATFDYGTATAPIYLAHERDIPVHVWVDETRPRNQGAALTTWELHQRGVPHTLIVDNAGGHLMQHGKVDLCLVGADRVTRAGDACNKIGTYLKALAARDNDVPFYVALPSSTLDWTTTDGVQEIAIEERSSREVTHVRGKSGDGDIMEVEVARPSVAVSNPAFDVTPARLLSGIITERGICDATEAALGEFFPEQK